MRHRGLVVGPHEEPALQRARAAYLDYLGPAAYAERAAAIATRPQKDWKGTTVYQLTCAADFGNGPHELWLPERVLWSLLDLGHTLCAYHR